MLLTPPLLFSAPDMPHYFTPYAVTPLVDAAAADAAIFAAADAAAAAAMLICLLALHMLCYIQRHGADTLSPLPCCLICIIARQRAC